MGIRLNTRKAQSQLDRAISIAKSDLDLPEDWKKRAELVGASEALTHTPVLGTALLAKATDSRVDALSLKFTSSPNAYSARTIAHNVLVPTMVRHGVSIRTTGREPLNNQPFFRYDRVDQMDRVLHKEGVNFLIECLREADTLDEHDALLALAAFVRVGLKRALEAAHEDLRKTSEVLREIVESAVTLASESVEGGKRAQAVTAAAFDVVYGAASVRTRRVNDPSRHFPGDVQVLGSSGEVIVSAEVKAKAVHESDFRLFWQNLVSAGISRGMLVAVAADQIPESHFYDLIYEAGESGVLMAVYTSMEDLLLNAFSWAKSPLAVVLEEFPKRLYQRLLDIEVASSTLDRLRQLMEESNYGSEEVRYSSRPMFSDADSDPD